MGKNPTTKGAPDRSRPCWRRPSACCIVASQKADSLNVCRSRAWGPLYPTIQSIHEAALSIELQSGKWHQWLDCWTIFWFSYLVEVAGWIFARGGFLFSKNRRAHPMKIILPWRLSSRSGSFNSRSDCMVDDGPVQNETEWGKQILKDNEVRDTLCHHLLINKRSSQLRIDPFYWGWNGFWHFYQQRLLNHAKWSKAVCKCITSAFTGICWFGDMDKIRKIYIAGNSFCRFSWFALSRH